MGLQLWRKQSAFQGPQTYPAPRLLLANLWDSRWRLWVSETPVSSGRETGDLGPGSLWVGPPDRGLCPPWGSI